GALLGLRPPRRRQSAHQRVGAAASARRRRPRGSHRLRPAAPGARQHLRRAWHRSRQEGVPGPVPHAGGDCNHAAAQAHLRPAQHSQPRQTLRLGGTNPAMSDAPIVIVPYRSFGTPDTLFVKGRVLRDKPTAIAEAERSAWSNLRDALRRIDSDEVPGARVGIHFDDQDWEAVADSEGYFTHSLPLAKPVEKTDAWYAVQLHLLEPALGEPRPY